jgi:hypothetical protein
MMKAMTDVNKKEKDLYYLDDLSDYKVASGYSDVRDWEVKDTNGRTVGKVEGLLASKSRKRVVYIDVDVNEDVIEEGHKVYGTSASKGVHEYLNKEGDTHLIIPIGMVRVDEENKEVHTDKIDHATFAKASRFDKDSSFDREYEVQLFRLYLGDPALVVPLDNTFYERNEFTYSSSHQPG